MKKGNAFVVQSNRLKKSISTKMDSSRGERTAQMICPLNSNFTSHASVQYNKACLYMSNISSWPTTHPLAS